LRNQDGRLVDAMPRDAVRMVFLMDSFTFGDGVRDEDAHPARTVALLGHENPSGSPRFEAYNLGAGAYGMGDAFPFRAIHEKIRAEVEGLDATLIDLYPRLRGQRDESLWVHPADQYPNEQVHRIAAEELAAALRALGPWR
jgi:hypothetical protein